MYLHRGKQDSHYLLAREGVVKYQGLNGETPELRTYTNHGG